MYGIGVKNESILIVLQFRVTCYNVVIVRLCGY